MTKEKKVMLWSGTNGLGYTYLLHKALGYTYLLLLVPIIKKKWYHKGPKPKELIFLNQRII